MCRTMMTRQMQTVYHPDISTVNKMCCVLGLEPMGAHSVRRNLFGAGSGGEPSVDEVLSRHMSEIAERSAKTWNFDFIEERPLSGGRYLWQKVFDDHVDCGSKDSSRLCKKENTLLVKTHEDGKSQLKCNSTAFLVQTSIRSYAKVQKPRSSKRLSPYLLKRSSSFPGCVLNDVGAS
ncbi:uncharacterized protein LOC129988759 [Argiope bruennichi]|uniref:Cyclin-dependent kinase inhibitor domain-containing protein n=1 Tax=Argiope bruennichi TaxID=94029 RepID=A0A8T0EEB4_ARGBR|nr:uncharacterized protein LOC129988759 [Argiope bruennichi]XP_055953002.1 uncharacterized protein LOC129988759 [Argiope bruennichi]KAF8770325.1 hypothetical protein HNY73_017870 [Argiope bruennichi]